MSNGTENPRSVSVPIPAKGIGTRISAACDELGTRKNAAQVLEVSVDSLARYIREENMPPFDVAARLCIATGRSLEWLATGQEPVKPVQDKGSPASQDSRLDNVKIAVQLLREVLDDADLDLTPEKHAEAAVILVQLLEMGLPEAEVLPFARRTFGRTTGGQANGGRAAAGG